MTQTNYTREIAETICTRMSEGESLRAICRDPGMPSEGTVRGWAVRGFDQRYRAARQMLLEFWADQILDIADDEETDPRSRQIRTGVRQWLMSKLAPRRYGDKVQIGGDPENPLQVMHSQVSLSELTDAQLEALQNFTKSLLVDAAQE
jgi:Bacteriophage Sf6, terminase small subunit-like